MWVIKVSSIIFLSLDPIVIYTFYIIFVSNFVSKKDIYKGVKAPLDLVYCNKCKLLQLKHSAPQEIMYKKFYWYRSGVTNTMKLALKDIAQVIKKMKILKKNDTILDIGANDGTFLSYFNKKKYNRIGCEPAKNLQNVLKENCDYVLNDFCYIYTKYCWIVTDNILYIRSAVFGIPVTSINQIIVMTKHSTVLLYHP